MADESAWKVIRLRQRGRAENRSGSQESTGGLSSRKGGGHILTAGGGTDGRAGDKQQVGRSAGETQEG